MFYFFDRSIAVTLANQWYNPKNFFVLIGWYSMVITGGGGGVFFLLNR
jgi:hypothetical protein